MPRLVKKRAAIPPIATTSSTPSSTPSTHPVDTQTKKLTRKKTSKPTEVLPRDALFIPGLPKDGGPPPVDQGTGGDLLSDESGLITVTFDRGSFRWLWDTAELHALKHYRQYGGMGLPSAGAGKRAVSSIREAGHRQYVTDHFLPGDSNGDEATPPTAAPKRLRKKATK